MRFALHGLLLVFVFTTSVQAKGIEISCEGSPKDAVLKVPDPANKLIHVICSKYGHIIHPVKDWIWTRPGAYSPVFFPSQMVRSRPKEVNSNSYFKSITVKELNKSEAREKWSILEDMFDKGDSKKLTGLEITAENNKGKKHIIYVFDNNWGYGCSPSCKKGNAFLLINKEKKDVSW